jgi:hypothetical protein
MCNHTAVAKALVIAVCTLAIALLTIGMGADSAWAGSDQPSGLKVTPVTSDVVFQPVTAAGDTRGSITMRMHALISRSHGAIIATNFLPQGDGSGRRCTCRLLGGGSSDCDCDDISCTPSHSARRFPPPLRIEEHNDCLRQSF